MNSGIWRGKINLSKEFKKNIRKGVSLMLSVAMVAGSVSLSDVGAVTVNAAEKASSVKAATGAYAMGKGQKVNSSTLFSAETGYGFSDVAYPDAAKDWVGGVYYPREEKVTTGSASYVTDGDGYLEIASKVWKETESTGFGVYTYENTSTLDFALDNADYKVSVELVNPTDKELVVSLEAEDITKASGVKVAAGAAVTQDITACLVDGVLNLKFLETSGSATKEEEAATGKVYVSKVTITKAATKTAGDKPTIFIASDSTVQTYETAEAPKTGWGQTLYNFFGDFIEERKCTDCGYSQSRTYETENVIIENRAIGGRSSKSFIEEGKFDDLLEDVKPGDYVLVQWGHNDATAARPNRYVSPADFEYWMQYYVDGVTQRGATPVLVTPVARYSYVSNADGTVTFVGNFEKYGDVMRKMAKEQNIPIVDLTASSVALCNEFGLEGAKALFMVHAGDTTHLQYYGAYKFAQCVAQGIVDYAAAGTTDKLDELAKLVVNKIPTNVPGSITGFKSTSVGSSSIGLTWEEEEDSELYYIYRAVLEDGQTIDDVDFSSAEKFSVSSTNDYTDGACAAGVTYVYAIRGFNAKGLGALSDKIQVTTKTAGWKFDINGDKESVAKADGPTDTGWTGVGAEMYDAARGYGWITRPGAGRDRGEQKNDSYSLMGRDFTIGAGEFALDIPNGDYEVTCYGGDLLPGTSTVKTSFGAEGKSIGSISVKQGVASATGTVRVEDGQLNITTDNYFNGFTVTDILKAPSSLEASEKSVSGSNMTFLLSFVGVDEAVKYNVYKKSSSDDAFTIVKTFTAEEYKDDDLGCRAMTAALGETYEYYMTCVTADGTESARSNIETVKAVLDEVKVPAAPTNVVCVDPASSTTGVQNTITISWSAASVADADKGKVIKYVIYRSAKAEGEKGFKAFEKVGETTETTFKDTYFDIDTNISYYYKVAALNAGGLSELSAACKTPVTGTLTPGNLEKYSDRALVAVNLAGEKGAETLISATDKDGNTLTKGVYLSWRSFEADFDNDNNLKTTFTVYRDGVAIAENVSVTNMVDEGGTSASTYKVVGSNDSAIGVKAVDTRCWEHQYLELNLYAPADETMPEYNGEVATCDYSANDMSLGDLDGDGVLELIVKWYPSNAKDNSGYGFTGKTFLDAYDVNWATGEVSLLYRIDMGINIRSGAHYTQFQVWDYDGDGKAEIAVKTAPGTTVLRPTDGTANTLAEAEYIDVPSSSLPTEKISEKNDYRNASGYVLDGPEYFTMFNGEDGSILDTTDFVPARGNVGAWGDAYGNRVDRFLSATAYLDGEKPYAVFSRGYYTRTCLTAYYVNNEGKLDVYWAFDTNEAGSEYEAQGNHGLSVNDVDNDGKDEIIYGSLTVDHDGTVKYSTGLGHGDAMHVSDWVEWNDGLEIMDVHEHDDAAYHVEIHDAETGEILMGYWTGKDTGRGVAADIDPTSAGAEWWSIASPTYEGNDEPSWDSTDGEVYSTQSKVGALIKLADRTPASNASIFWDGDLLSEVQDHTFNKEAYAPTGVKLYKWDYEKEEQVELLSSTEIWSSNGTKGNLGIIADFLGDWREEIIARCAADKNKVRVYTTTIQTDYVVPCLLENLAYREGVAWENVGYNQPANLSYLLSEGLVTSQLMVGQLTKNSAEIAFTEASDGTYGHEVTGYQIYRAEGDGAFELIDTISKDELVEYVPDKEQPEEPEEPDTTEPPVWLKLDFGGADGKNSSKVGPLMDGYTEITSASPSYEDSTTGYGLTADSLKGITFRYYEGGTTTFTDKYDSSYASLFDDCAMGWNSDVVFKADVPNGTYDVTVLTSHVSGTAKNLIYVEDMDNNVARYANKNEANVTTTTVEVKDGVLEIKITLDQGYKGAVVLSGLEIKASNYDELYKAWLETNMPKYLKFDFGGVDGKNSSKVGPLMDGYTEITSASPSYEDSTTGYGLTADSLKGITFRYYEGGTTTFTDKYDSSYASLFDDCAMGWNSDVVFKADVPNGTYDVTVLTSHVSGTAKNLIYVEDMDNNVARYANKNEANVTTTTVEVKDGVLEIKITLDQGYKGAVVLSGLEIKASNYDEWMDKYFPSTDEPEEPETPSGSESAGETEPTSGSTGETEPTSGSTGETEPTSESAGETEPTSESAGETEPTSENTSESESESESSSETEQAPAYLRFDFGAGTVEDGWTQVLAADEYSDEKGYGFVFGDGLAAAGSEKKYTSNAESLAAVADDCVLGWDATNPMEFDVKVPNGTYEVTYYIFNGSGGVYNQVTAEDVAFSDVRRGSGSKEFTNETKEVTVSDGTLNIVNKSSKSGQPGLYFTGIVIKDVNYDEWLKNNTSTDTASTDNEAAEESQPSDEQATEAQSAEEELTISLNNVRTVAASESTEEDTVKYYSYVDKTVKPDTTYRYKIAAVVDGKTSFMSRELELHTLVDIASIDEFSLPDLVQNQVLAAGQKLADLLPAQLSVTDTNNNKTVANVKWDVTNVDIKTPGEYKVIGTVAGWDTPIEKTVKVVPNVSTGYAKYEDITVIVGNQPTLPTKLTATFLNGQTIAGTVTWDTSNLDVNTVGEYVLKGTSNLSVGEITITVKVAANYIVSLYTRYWEIYLNETEYTLPNNVYAVWADGTASYVSAEWDKTTHVDVTVLGTTKLTGTVEGFDGTAELELTVDYPVAKRFDFGIEGSAVEDGWIGVLGNVKNGTKTLEKLGSAYSKDKGYGFLDGKQTNQGRDEGAYKPGTQLPDNVYRDYIMPDGNTFRVDVPNGKYIVELVGGCGLGSSKIEAKVQGESISVSNGKATYAVGEIETVVTEGYIDIEFVGSLSRTCAVIVRTVSVDGKEEPEEPPTEAPTETPSEEPSTEAPTGTPSEEPSTEAPTETPSEEPSTEAPTEAPSEEPSTEAPTEAPSEEPSTEAPTEAPSEESSTEAPTEAPSVKPSTEAQAEKPSVKPLTEKSGEAATETSGTGYEYRGHVGELTVDVVPDVVKEKLNCSTTEEVAELLARMITENEAVRILPDVKAENTMVFDYVIKIKRSNGEWTDASEEELSAGVEVVLPYPENTSRDGFDFVIGHLIVSGDNAGEMEYFDPEKTEEGLKIIITSASPFVIGWKAVDNNEQPVSEENSKDNTEVTTAENATSQQNESNAVSAEKTADKDGGIQIIIPMLIVLVVIALAAAVLAVIAKRKKTTKKK